MMLEAGTDFSELIQRVWLGKSRGIHKIRYGTTIKAIPSDLILEVTEEL